MEVVLDKKMEDFLRCDNPENSDPFGQQLVGDMWLIQHAKKFKKPVKRITLSCGETCWAGNRVSPLHPTFYFLPRFSVQ